MAFLWRDVACEGMQLNPKVSGLYLMDSGVWYERAEEGANVLKPKLHSILLFVVDVTALRENDLNLHQVFS